MAINTLPQELILPSDANPLVSVIVPAFNEAGRICEPLDLLQNSLEKSYGSDFEILVIDDGSTDNTSSVAAEMGAKVLTLPGNQGKGGALRNGMLSAKGSVVRAFTDADGSISAQDVVKLIDTVGEGPAVIAIAERQLGPDQHDSIARLIGGRALNNLCKLVLPTNIRDTQCGAKAFDSVVSEDLFGQSTINGFGIDLEVLYKAQARSLEVASIPVKVTPKDGSTVRPVRDGLRMLNETYKVRKAIRN